MVTKKEIMRALKKVLDPELGINIVDLGLVYDVKVENDDVSVKMTLTTPGCPLHTFFVRDVERAIKELGAKNVDVKITFDPPWSPKLMSKKARKILGL